MAPSCIQALSFSNAKVLIVQRIRDNLGWNRALCDKSANFGIVVVILLVEHRVHWLIVLR